ncbi:integrase [Vibrio parahaemolyticus]|uniref:integrase n=1 Tax=Vibrio parahaemolyticus TaxID=670 RepID=UPI002361613B|nr:integrase [Vibrio parahaemolyticus]
MRKSSSGKCSGIKRLFKLEEIWRIRTRLEIENDLMQLALLNLAIDSKLRASDLQKLHVYNVSSQGVTYDRVQCIQQKKGTDAHYEITPRTQQSISRWIFAASLEASSFLFPSSRRSGQPISYSFYRAIIRSWAVQILLGHSKLDNTIRYLGVELEDALRLSEKTDC